MVKWPPHDFHDEQVGRGARELAASCKNAVVVGWRLHKKKGANLKIFQDLLQFVDSVILVDAFEPNIEDFKSVKGDLNVTPLNMDIRDFEALPDLENCLLVWLHGPEHLEMEESKALLQSMKSKFSGMLIETPLGEYPQGALYNNPFEEHKSAWHMEDFTSVGFHASYHGPRRWLVGYWKK